MQKTTLPAALPKSSWTITAPDRASTRNGLQGNIPMASYDTTRSLVAGPTATLRFFSAFTGVAGSIAAWNDARVTRNALSKLSDHELDDLGLTRGDISSMRGRLNGF